MLYYLFWFFVEFVHPRNFTRILNININNVFAYLYFTILILFILMNNNYELINLGYDQKFYIDNKTFFRIRPEILGLW